MQQNQNKSNNIRTIAKYATTIKINQKKHKCVKIDKNKSNKIKQMGNMQHMQKTKNEFEQKRGKLQNMQTNQQHKSETRGNLSKYPKQEMKTHRK